MKYFSKRTIYCDLCYQIVVQSDSSEDMMQNITNICHYFWTDIIHLMSSKPQSLTSIGPMRAFATNSKKISTELIEINEDLLEFNQHLN